MTDELEAARLRALEAYRVLDTGPEASFDRLTALAADLFDAPMALIALVDADRQWFKSRYGVAVDSTPRSTAFCAHAIELAAGATMVIEDAALDPRFAANPFVTGDPKIRFYAGAVLTGADGFNLGALCVMDTKPRPTPSEQDLGRLKTLASIVVGELELRRLRAVETERSRFERLANAVAGVGYWRLDVATRQITWSDQMFFTYGLAPGAEPALDAAMAMSHPDDRAAAEARVRPALETGENWTDGLTRIIRPDGETRFVEGRGVCECDATGAVTAIIGTMVDVTQRKRAEVAAVEAEAERRANIELFENAFDYAAIGMALVGLDGRFLKVNAAFCDLVGYGPARMLGLDFQSITHPDDLEIDLDHLARLTAGEIASYQMEKRYIRSNGAVVDVNLSVSMVTGADGKPRHYVSQVQDLTARKAAEAQLLQARLEAEAAAAVKSEFLANMSHELRTPLTSIVGFTRLAAEQADLQGLTRNYVERVGEASRALLCTVNDILDFSRLEAGQISFQPEPSSLFQLSRATLDLFMPQAGAKDLHLVLDGEPEGSELALMLDPDRIRQILLNLVGNAVKFTDAGSVTLRTRYNRRAARLSVEVIDTGPGIPPDKQALLFKRFSQVDGSLTRSHGGTGLGLAICKGLVEAMGGQIGAVSRTGKGSRFWFSIPAQMGVLPSATASGASAEQPTFSGIRVLVVDDHPANRDLARLILAGVGAEVTEAADGVEAAALASLWPFDVILMDLRMPNLDGRGALRKIRGEPGPNDATPILAFTADADAANAEGLAAMGFQDVVGKPLEPVALIVAVARAAAFANEDQPEEDAADVA
jgi:PAS domain S-box-containing protein